MGEPGSGKTILLLQLAESLLNRANGNDKQPIPVVFHLSTWAVRRLHLADWLVDELSMRYNVNRGLGEKWVNEDIILPLLDGLDEVSKEHREACVEAINIFREQHGLLPLVVCSRREEYDALKVRLKLPTAVIVKTLTRSQVEQYLKSIGTPMEGVQVTLHDYKVLWELLETPLMLNIVTLAFKGKSAESVHGTGGLDVRRRQVFEAYKNAMFERPGRSSVKSYNYTPQQTEHWLSWLAKSMKQHDQSIFYLELMQPNWLPSLRLQRVLEIGASLIAFLVFGLAAALASSELSARPSTKLAYMLGVWLIGVLMLTQNPQYERFHFIEPKEMAKWLGFGLAFGMVNLPIIWIGRGFWMGFGLLLSIEESELDIRKDPNEGIHESAKNALTVGLPISLVCGLAFGVARGMAHGLTAGLVRWAGFWAVLWG